MVALNQPPTDECPLKTNAIFSDIWLSCIIAVQTSALPMSLIRKKSDSETDFVLLMDSRRAWPLQDEINSRDPSSECESHKLCEAPHCLPLSALFLFALEILGLHKLRDQGRCARWNVENS